MTKAVSFEIQTLQAGKWELDSVHERKDDAMHEARRMLSSRKHIEGVKVLQEEFDSEENLATSHVLLNEIRGAKKSKIKTVQKEEQKENLTPITPRLQSQKKGSFTSNMLYMVLGICAVMLGVIGLAYFYTDAFK